MYVDVPKTFKKYDKKVFLKSSWYVILGSLLDFVTNSLSHRENHVVLSK